MEQAELFLFTIEQTLEMMIFFEQKGTILYANPAAESMLKYPESLSNRSIAEIFPREEDLKVTLVKCMDEMQIPCAIHKRGDHCHRK